ncbi:Uncharacterised protein [Streptococcus pneumoniae]|nr:Uncharacterised protein [Streptococcus pneumoniae]
MLRISFKVSLVKIKNISPFSSIQLFLIDKSNRSRNIAYAIFASLEILVYLGFVKKTFGN